MIFFSIALSAILIVALFIFTNKKATPWRYMFPGIITFFFFVFIPMLFTISIGLTNLGTGHIFSLKYAKEVLLSEFEIDDESTITTFKIEKENNQFKFFIDEKYYGELSSLNETILNLDFKPNKNFTTNLTKDEIISLQSELSKIDFVLPDNKRLKIFRTDLVAEILPRFVENHEGHLIERKTGNIYVPNKQSGYYENGEKHLAPGFYVFTGLKNYLELFTNKELRAPFAKIFTWTITWALISVFLSFSAGMLLALFTNNPIIRAKSFFRILIIIPYSIPFFISVLVFKGMLNKDFGIFNKLLSYLAISPIPWLESSIWAKVSVLMVNFWLGFPYMFLVITGILQSIPTSVYEAAKLDGASRSSTFFKITLPLIMSSIAPLLIGSFAFNLNNFVGIYLLTGGLPPMQGVSTPVGETDILISYTYRLAFEGGQGQNFGLASSISLIIFFIIALLTYLNFRLTHREKS